MIHSASAEQTLTRLLHDMASNVSCTAVLDANSENAAMCCGKHMHGDTISMHADTEHQ